MVAVGVVPSGGKYMNSPRAVLSWATLPCRSICWSSAPVPLRKVAPEATPLRSSRVLLDACELQLDLVGEGRRARR